MSKRTQTYSAIIHKNSNRAFRRGECGMTPKGFKESYSAQLVVDVLGKPLKTLPHPSTRVTSKYTPHIGKKHAAKLEARALTLTK